MSEIPEPQVFQASDIAVLGSRLYRCEFNFPRDQGDDLIIGGETVIKHQITFLPQNGIAAVRLELHAGLSLDGMPSPVVLGAEFRYGVRNLDKYLEVEEADDGQRANVDDTFASILIGISLSTMRGIWSGIAKQTPFPDLHIQVYNPMEILDGPTLDD